LVGCRGGSSQRVEAPSVEAIATPTATVTPPPLSEAQQQFVSAFIEAANAKNAAAMRKLILPESLACYSKDTEPHLDHWVAKRLRYTIPPDYKVRFASYGGHLRASPFFSTPGRPTDTMEIEFSVEGGRHIKLSEFAVQRGGSYQLFAPCFSAIGVERFKAHQAEREAGMRKAREVYSTLKDPLRARLMALVKEGKRRDALNLCMHELSLDRKTAAYVVDLATGREPM
jgi:hypothetical protein